MAKRKKTYTLKNEDSPYRKVSQEAREVILDNNGFLRHRGKRDEVYPYQSNKKNKLALIEGYDLLQNLMYVKKFIKNKYNITSVDLELLLYLFPKNYFTYTDYLLAMPFKRNNIDVWVERKMIDVVFNNQSKRKRLYRLSVLSQSIVRNFYAYLSGEKVIDPKSRYHPIPKTGAYNKILNLSFELIKKADDQGHKKVFYEK